MKCVAELTGDFVVCIVPVAGWEIEKEEREERDRRKSGGADVANRERTADAVIFIRRAGKSTSPREPRRHRLRLVYIRTLDGGQKKAQKDGEECNNLTASHFTIRPCVHKLRHHTCLTV